MDPDLSQTAEKTKTVEPTSNLLREIYTIRRKVLNGIIDESATLIDIQSSLNRSFKSRTCPHAAISLGEATLYQMARK